MADARASAAECFRASVAEATEGRFERALELIDEALAFDNRPPYRYARADYLAGAGRRDEAVAALESLAVEEPAFAPALLRLGEMRLAAGDVEEAIRALEAAARLRPTHLPTLLALARAALAVGDPERASCLARQAISLDPALHQAHAILGHALQRQSAHTRAEAAFASAAAGSRDPALWLTLANARLNIGRVPAAIEALDHAERLDPPDAAQIGSARLLAMHYDSAFGAEEIFAAHLAWAKRHAREVPQRPARARDGGGRRLRVGYVSPRLHRGTVGSLIAAVFESHDKAAFAVHAYMCADFEDATTARIRAAADGWCEAWRLDDAALAQRMRADGIDIAIDLAGHTPGHRLGAFALRPAPVAASWLDYFDTTGLAAIDLVVSDRWHAPPGDRQQFTERIARLPGLRYCWEPPSDPPPVAAPPCATRDAFVFGSFNRYAKLSEATVAAWSEVLRAVPDSRLLLKSGTLDNPEEHPHARARFAAFGIDPARIECRGQSPHAQMLAEYADVDLVLDSFPYNGGVTTLEALWMGRPVLALAGDSMIARQSAAILECIGMPEWIARGKDDFVRIGREAAADRARFARACAGIRERVAGSPVTDARAFTRGLEDVLRQAWREAT